MDYMQSYLDGKTKRKHQVIIEKHIGKLSDERLEREKAQLSLFDIGMERNRYE